jgi:hypothetical protein
MDPSIEAKVQFAVLRDFKSEKRKKQTNKKQKTKKLEHDQRENRSLVSNCDLKKTKKTLFQDKKKHNEKRGQRPKSNGTKL